MFKIITDIYQYYDTSITEKLLQFKLELLLCLEPQPEGDGDGLDDESFILLLFDATKTFPSSAPQE